jgi:DNA-binding PadR family transcriptional regulator
MTEIKVTNMVKFYAVLLLCEKPMHGYELIKEIGARLECRVSPGQIYPFLGKLQKNGLIAVKKSGKREKKVYALTRGGKAFARRMIARFGDLIGLAIEPKLTLCAHCGCKVYQGAHEEAIAGKRLRFCCRHCAASFKKGR